MLSWPVYIYMGKLLLVELKLYRRRCVVKSAQSRVREHLSRRKNSFDRPGERKKEERKNSVRVSGVHKKYVVSIRSLILSVFSVEDGPVVLWGDPRRFHPCAAIPLRDQPHIPLLLQVPYLLWHRNDERGAAHTRLLAVARQCEEFSVSIQSINRSILLRCALTHSLSHSFALSLTLHAQRSERVFFPFCFVMSTCQVSHWTRENGHGNYWPAVRRSKWVAMLMVAAMMVFVMVVASMSHNIAVLKQWRTSLGLV